MRTAVRPALPIFFVFAVFAIVKAQSAQAQISRYDELANLPFVNNRPTPETAKILSDELLFQRATQTYLWALPLINTLGMKVGSEEDVWRGLQRASNLEEASRCQDAGDNSEFRCHLCDELR